MNSSDFTFRDPGEQGYHYVTEAISSTGTARNGHTLIRVTVTTHEEIQGSSSEEVIIQELERNGDKENGLKVKRVRLAFYKDLIIKVVSEQSSLDEEDVNIGDGGDGGRGEGTKSSGDLRSDELSLEESC